jgi:1-acyl-sn-glycerol-3-phosphate acyltransferase
MLGHLITGPILGTFTLLLLVINTLLWGLVLYIFAFFKLLSPEGPVKRFFGMRVAWVASTWFDCNLLIMWLCVPVTWNVEMPDTLSNKKNYLVTCNHQSWVDIVALFYAMNGKVPFFRFFLKEELRKIPVLGHAWMALDYPFMKRYSKAQIEANPELAGKDIEATKLACEKYQGIPVTVVNFMEGTRFKADVHQKQQSPYQNLLKPKAGGISFVMSSMGEQIGSLLNVTILYPRGVQEIWPFFCGQLREITVIVHEQPLPPEMSAGDYGNDPEFRTKFQGWVTQLWEEKDAFISSQKNPK